MKLNFTTRHKLNKFIKQLKHDPFDIIGLYKVSDINAKLLTFLFILGPCYKPIDFLNKELDYKFLGVDKQYCEMIESYLYNKLYKRSRK